MVTYFKAGEVFLPEKKYAWIVDTHWIFLVEIVKLCVVVNRLDYTKIVMKRMFNIVFISLDFLISFIIDIGSFK